MKKLIKELVDLFRHFVGRCSKKYYFEDYVRVYPDGVKYNWTGIKKNATKTDINNYLNHRKFYMFVSQFVKDKSVSDVGCGSGYGCKIMKENGAKSVNGFDISKSSIKYAKSKFGDSVDFSISSITEVSKNTDKKYDITISSEVLEHIKEYHMEQQAIEELRKITKKDGLVIIGTPNLELLDNHGFSYDEMKTLFSNNFKNYVIFENAFMPFGERKEMWNKRVEDKNTGVVVSELINLEESCIPDGCEVELKKGLEPGIYKFGDYDINTKLLHNTHSWLTIAINE